MMDFAANTIAVPGWAIYLAGLAYLIAFGLIMCLMKAAARADKMVKTWQQRVVTKQMYLENVNRQIAEMRLLDGAGPEVTARTLAEDEA